MDDNNYSAVVAYPPVKFPIKKEFMEPEEVEMEEEEEDESVEAADESFDEGPLLKEIEGNQHPIAYAPVKFKQCIKQEPEDAEDLIQEDAESIEGISNHSSLDGVETIDESSDEGPLPSSSTTIGSSKKGEAMKRAHKTSSHPKQKENSGIQRSAALERPFKCDKCESSFKCKEYLKDHLRRICGKERSFLCKQCGSRFKRKPHLKRHLTTIHKIGPSQLSEFDAGPQNRPVMPFKCNHCDRSYKSQKILNDHLRIECDKKSIFPCTQCEFRTKRKKSLQCHLMNVHDIEPSQLALFGAGPVVRPVMAFKCDQCERTYKFKGSLQRHVVEKHSTGANENSDGH